MRVCVNSYTQTADQQLLRLRVQLLVQSFMHSHVFAQAHVFFQSRDLVCTHSPFRLLLLSTLVRTSVHFRIRAFMRTFIYSPSTSFFHSLITSIVCACNHSLFHLCLLLSVLTFPRHFIGTFIHSSIRPLRHSFVCSLFHPIVRSFVDLFTHSLTHSLTHAFLH